MRSQRGKEEGKGRGREVEGPDPLSQISGSASEHHPSPGSSGID